MDIILIFSSFHVTNQFLKWSFLNETKIKSETPVCSDLDVSTFFYFNGHFNGQAPIFVTKHSPYLKKKVVKATKVIEFFYTFLRFGKCVQLFQSWLIL